MIVFLLGVILVAIAIAVAFMAVSESEPKVGVSRSIAVLEAMTSAPEELTKELDRPFER